MNVHSFTSECIFDNERKCMKMKVLGAKGKFINWAHLAHRMNQKTVQEVILAS